MKVVFLVAGRGRRLKDITKNTHKALIQLDDKSLLHNLIENCIYAGITDFVPIIGHCSEQIVDCFSKDFSKNININYIKNKEFNTSNNLYSLYCARDILEGEEFLLCNADIVLDKNIIKGIVNTDKRSYIAIDDYNYTCPIDSPGIIEKNGKILDLGRHVSFKQNMGYAIGVYKFNEDLSKVFFNKAEELLKLNINAGFHDPLPELFKEIDIYKYQTNKLLWTDIDTFEDIKKAKEIHQHIVKGYLNDC